MNIQFISAVIAILILPAISYADDNTISANSRIGLNLSSSMLQRGNSKIGSPASYMGWSRSTQSAQKSAWKTNNPQDTTNSRVKSGIEQAGLISNTQVFNESDWVLTKGSANNYSFGNNFGSITTGDKTPIAALNNKDSLETTMQKTFTVPTGTKQVTVDFNANFVTNEFPDFKNSTYNDKAIVEIKTGSGNVYPTTVYAKEVKTANLKAVTGLPKPLVSSGGQTGFEHITQKIPVANGGTITMTVKTINARDITHPTAALINKPSVK